MSEPSIEMHNSLEITLHFKCAVCGKREDARQIYPLIGINLLQRMPMNWTVDNFGMVYCEQGKVHRTEPIK